MVASGADEAAAASAGQESSAEQGRKASPTVDGDGDALGEDEAISADEGRDLVKGVGLEELFSGLGGVGLDLLEVDAVGLRDGADGRGAGVALENAPKSANKTSGADEKPPIVRIASAARGQKKHTA